MWIVVGIACLALGLVGSWATWVGIKLGTTPQDSSIAAAGISGGTVMIGMSTLLVLTAGVILLVEEARRRNETLG